MSTYTTTEVRNKIASDIRFWRRCKREGRPEGPALAQLEHRQFFDHHIYALRFLALQFRKDSFYAVTDRISA